MRLSDLLQYPGVSAANRENLTAAAVLAAVGTSSLLHQISLDWSHDSLDLQKGEQGYVHKRGGGSHSDSPQTVKGEEEDEKNSFLYRRQKQQLQTDPQEKMLYHRGESVTIDQSALRQSESQTTTSQRNQVYKKQTRNLKKTQQTNIISQLYFQGT